MEIRPWFHFDLKHKSSPSLLILQSTWYDWMFGLNANQKPFITCSDENTDNIDISWGPEHQLSFSTTSHPLLTPSKSSPLVFKMLLIHSSVSFCHLTVSYVSFSFMCFVAASLNCGIPERGECYPLSKVLSAILWLYLVLMCTANRNCSRGSYCLLTFLPYLVSV